MKLPLAAIWKKYKLVLLVAAVGVVLMLLPGGKQTQSAQAETDTRGTYSLEETERRMETLLGRISGTGQLSLMLTVQSGAELELAETEDRFRALKKAIATLVVEYDYIIIDCPPSLGLLSLNALVASDTLIVPLQCEYYALEGLSQLLSTVRTVKQHYNPHLELQGVVFTMYDSRLKLTQQVVDEVEKYFPGKTYHTMIPRSVKLAEAPSYGKPVLYYEKYCKASFAYKKLADEVVKQSR